MEEGRGERQKWGGRRNGGEDESRERSHAWAFLRAKQVWCQESLSSWHSAGAEMRSPFLWQVGRSKIPPCMVYAGNLQQKPGAYTLKPGLQNPSNQGGKHELELRYSLGWKFDLSDILEQVQKQTWYLFPPHTRAHTMMMRYAPAPPQGKDSHTYPPQKSA